MNATDTFDRPALRAQLALGEGRKLRWYWDTSKPPCQTIGVGRNLTTVGIRPAENHALGITVRDAISHGITDAQCDYLLDSDINVAVAALDTELPWWRRMNAVRQRVVIDMVFNMGIGRRPTLLRKGTGLLAFTNTLAKMQACDYAGAAAGMEASAWDAQTKGRADRLEAMMRTGVAS